MVAHGGLSAISNHEVILSTTDMGTHCVCVLYYRFSHPHLCYVMTDRLPNETPEQRRLRIIRALVKRYKETTKDESKDS